MKPPAVGSPLWFLMLVAIGVVAVLVARGLWDASVGFELYTAYVASVAGLLFVFVRDWLSRSNDERNRQRDLAIRILASFQTLRAAFGADPRYVVRPKIETLRPLAGEVRRLALELRDPLAHQIVDDAARCMELYFRLVRAGVGTPRAIANRAVDAADTALRAVIRDEESRSRTDLDEMIAILDREVEAAKLRKASVAHPAGMRARLRIVRDRIRERTRYPSEFD